MAGSAIRSEIHQQKSTVLEIYFKQRLRCGIGRYRLFGNRCLRRLYLNRLQIDCLGHPDCKSGRLFVSPV